MEYTIIRSRRKTVAIQITPGGEVVLRCPNRMPKQEVLRFAESKRDWIEKHLAKLSAKPQLSPFTEAELRDLRDRAMRVIPVRTEYFAQLLGVSYGRITIRCQRSRWGSCSSTGNLNFNCLLTLVPPEVLDYVIVHELCHRLEMNHSQAFWEKVAKTLPDYRQQRKWLKDHGSALIGRL